ncbi:MAG: hypothetical protein U1C51_05165, partial [Candidatus Izemoplasmatales bacterium]|nr:hypothetical protein [Candidatus Izemoplasmatales bacterium]
MTKKRIYRFSMMILHAFLLVFLSLSIIPSLNEQTNHLPIETKSYETYQSLYYPFELVWNGTITP